MKWWVRLGFILLPSLAVAQPYGNEWIDFSRPYYRLKVGKEGVHRIDSTVLANSGIPIASIDPRTISLYGKEQEVAIYIEGENDGVFNGSDFIEFYSSGNDGWMDVDLYESPNLQTNPHFSLFSDTVHYYLTWEASPTPLRAISEEDTTFSSYTPLDWFWAERYKGLQFYYYPGQQYAHGLSLPEYGEGEGWFGPQFEKGASQQIGVSTRHPYTGPGAPQATATTVIASTNNANNGVVPNHHVQMHYGDPASILAIDTIFTGYKLIDVEFPIQPEELINGNTLLRVSSLDGLPGLPAGYPDYNALSHGKIRYAQEFVFNGYAESHMYIPYNNNGPKSHLQWTGLSGSDPILYVLNGEVRRILPTVTGAIDQALIPNIAPGVEAHCYLQRRFLIEDVESLEPVGTNGFFTDYSSGPDSAFVIITASAFLNEANAYAAYRSNNPHNQFNTQLITVEELYDQFGGGVPHHPLSIRRFAELAVNEWNTKPSYLFLIGKASMQAELAGGTLGSRRQADRYAADLIPTMGFPPSDVAFTAKLDHPLPVPAIATGRLSARTPGEVNDYLAKVMVQEAQVPDEWMKRVLHFRGGSGISEWQLFDYYLGNYEAVIEDTCFGGFVHNFKKNSSDIIEEYLSDSVATLINDGVSLMTFFGHASGGGFDINIDYPENYEWNGHHPLMIGNSCFTGNIHLFNAASTSEQFVIAEDKGAIAFLASVDAGLTTWLNLYSMSFYQALSSTHYGKGIGEIMKQAVLENLTNSSSFEALNNSYSMTLHGDPAIILNAHDKPDFSVKPESISFFPEEVDSQLETFEVRVLVSNIGKATNDAFQVKLTRTLPTGVDTSYLHTISPLYFEETVVFELPVLINDDGLGLNNIRVSLDLGPDVVAELDDVGNNVVNKELFIRSGAIEPVWPYKFQVLPDPEPTLKASTGDPFADPKDYIFQIDTTDLFSSPVLQSTTINAPGGVVEWDPPSIFALNDFADSTVFYWRASPDSTQDQPYIWKESSFQYIANRDGWGQSHYYQFKDNRFHQVVYDRPERDYDFFSGSRSVRCNVKGNPQVGEYHLSQWFIDLEWQDGDGCNTVPAFHVAVIDPETFEPWGTMYGTENPDHSFGNQNDGSNCRNRVEYYFSFRQNYGPMADGMLDMLQNQIPDGHYVLIYTWFYLNRYGAANLDLIPEIQSLGADSITLIPDSVPYIFFVQKGDPNSAIEVWGESINDEINLSVPVQVSGKTGTMSSVVAGPAAQWNGMYWSQHPEEQPTQDSTRVKLFGIMNDGSELELIDSNVGMDSIVPLYNYVDAQLYPYVRLQTYLHDPIADATPAQMDRWHLLHDPVPECAIDPNLGFYLSTDSLNEGQDISIAIAIHNISDYDMDSLLVAYTVRDQSNNVHDIPYARQAPLPAGAVLYDTLTIASLNFGGLNHLRVEVNPIDPNTGTYDQLEQYHFNNIAEIPFRVERDIINPLLDVTFDGIHILDGEIISSRPEITVKLDDENPWLIMQSAADTALFKFYMTYPDGYVEQIFFQNGQGEEILQFIPATGNDNVAYIHYAPHFEQDGMHTLQVRAKDLSDNTSGDLDYQVRFEVVQQATITDVLNYPNPFTTKTQFVFTVTGSEAPTYMQIQIMTITGRVVREITNQELGPLRVGRNITDFYWDGTDQYGDRLAQGVYLYKVTAKLHGEDIQYRESGASPYFKKGIGKMYLLGR